MAALLLTFVLALSPALVRATPYQHGTCVPDFHYCGSDLVREGDFPESWIQNPTLTIDDLEEKVKDPTYIYSCIEAESSSGRNALIVSGQCGQGEMCEVDKTFRSVYCNVESWEPSWGSSG